MPPGSTWPSVSRCAVASRSIRLITTALSATESPVNSSRTPLFASAPNMLRWLDALDSIATSSTVTPARTISTKLRNRLTSGLRRLLRGIAHAVLTAFCAAWPSPRTPYSAASDR